MLVDVGDQEGAHIFVVKDGHYVGLFLSLQVMKHPEIVTKTFEKGLAEIERKLKEKD